jgi:Zn-dependent protease with chaperone function
MTERFTMIVALRALEIHLMFATFVGLAAWLFTSARKVSATTKYWIWVATSLNFVLPIGVFFDRLRPPDLAWVLPLDDVGRRFAGIRTAGAAVAATWAIGAVLMLARLLWRIGIERSAEAAASGAPGVNGLLRPRISLPAGIRRRLNRRELDAVLLHELAHARRRDNLIRLVHEIGLCLFWFHPLAWLAGSRLSLYRELSCDESVIRGARGEDLISALAKLANPPESLLLQARASSYLGDRVASLVSPRPTSRAANALLAAIFAVLLLAAILGSAFQSNLMHRAALGEFCPRLAAELAGNAK